MKNINHSHLTAKKRTKLSFPAKWIYERGFLKGNVLDYGCGFGTDVEFLKSRNIDISGYDKHYFPTDPLDKYDTIICNYVLNVLTPDDQPEVLMNISELLKPGGKAYFTVRRDLKAEGFRVHKMHKLTTYQCNVRLPFKSILRNDFCEIYEYRHFNAIGKSSECPFCAPDSSVSLISETATAFAVFDKYPVSHGHCLVIPKKHISNYFELTLHEQRACWLLINRCKEIIEKQFSPHGFNVGININEAAGQSINHVHIHLIPRYTGDVDDPFGGVRGVVPEKRWY